MKGVGLYSKFHGESVESDWFRTVSLYELCRSIPGLYAPRPVKIDLKQKIIMYERVDCSLPLMQANGKLEEVLYQFGQKLAEFHILSTGQIACSAQSNRVNSFSLGLGLDSVAANQLTQELPLSFLHGDCWHGNVFVSEPGSFLILDPLPANRFRYVIPDVGNPALDIAFLFFSIKICMPLFSLVGSDSEYRAQLAHAALDGYLSKMQAETCRNSILKLSHLLGAIWLDDLPRRLQFPIGQIKRFIGYGKLEPRE